MKSIDIKNALPPGYVLGNYELESMLGHGGFGITYRARHRRLGMAVAIKEYLPVDWALRDGRTTVSPRSGGHREGYEKGLKRFLEEAQSLAKFDHPNIVGVRDFSPPP